MLLNLNGNTEVTSLYTKQNPSADHQQFSITNWQLSITEWQRDENKLGLEAAVYTVYITIMQTWIVLASVFIHDRTLQLFNPCHWLTNAY